MVASWKVALSLALFACAATPPSAPPPAPPTAPAPEPAPCAFAAKLLLAARDDDARVRQSVAQYLDVRRPPCSLDAALALGGDQDPLTKQAALRAIGGIHVRGGGDGPAALDALVAASHDAEWQIRSTALEVLSHCDGWDSAHVAGVRPLLDDDVPMIAIDAALALARAAPSSELEERAVELIRLHVDGPLRWKCLMLLDRLTDPRDLEFVRGLLENGDRGVRDHARWAKSRLEGSDPADDDAIEAQFVVENAVADRRLDASPPRSRRRRSPARASCPVR